MSKYRMLLQIELDTEEELPLVTFKGNMESVFANFGEFMDKLDDTADLIGEAEALIKIEKI